MGRRTLPDDEEYVEEDDDLDEARLPPAPPAPPADWAQPLRAGPVLPAPLDLPEAEIRLKPTRSWQILRFRSVAVSVALGILIPLGILAVITRGDLTLVPIAFYGWLLLMAVVVAVSSLMAPSPKLLKLDAGGITYDHAAFILKAGWAAVEGIVQIGDKPEALTVRLSVPSATWERPAKRPAWRKTAYPWDQTIPLFPFLRGDRHQAVLRYIAAALPRLEGVPATVEAAVAQPAGRRVAAGAIAIVPAVVLNLAFSLTQGSSQFTLALNTILVTGYMLAVLARRRGIVGERVVDFVARVMLLREGPERPSAVLRTIGGAYLGFALFVGLGFALASISPGTSTSALVAKYGPAHTCWQNDQAMITGCTMSTGVTLGSVGPKQVTCFFNEPLPDTATTFHCKP